MPHEKHTPLCHPQNKQDGKREGSMTTVKAQPRNTRISLSHHPLRPRTPNPPYGAWIIKQWTEGSQETRKVIHPQAKSAPGSSTPPSHSPRRPPPPGAPSPPFPST